MKTRSSKWILIAAAGLALLLMALRFGGWSPRSAHAQTTTGGSTSGGLDAGPEGDSNKKVDAVPAAASTKAASPGREQR